MNARRALLQTVLLAVLAFALALALAPAAALAAPAWLDPVVLEGRRPAMPRT